MLHGFGPLESVEFSDGSTTPLFGLTSGNKYYIRFQFQQDGVDSFQVWATCVFPCSLLGSDICFQRFQF